MNKKITRLKAFTLAEGGHSPLLYGDEGVAEGYSCVETKGHKVLHASRIGKSHNAKMTVKFPSPKGRGGRPPSRSHHNFHGGVRVQIKIM